MEIGITLFIVVRTLNLSSNFLKILRGQYIIFDYRYNAVPRISRAYSSYLSFVHLLISNALFPPPPSALLTIILVFDFMNWTILDTSYKWNRALSVLLCLAYFIELTVLQVHLCHCILQNFIFLKAEQQSLVCIYHIFFLFVYQ